MHRVVGHRQGHLLMTGAASGDGTEAVSQELFYRSNSSCRAKTYHILTEQLVNVDCAWLETNRMCLLGTKAICVASLSGLPFNVQFVRQS